MRDIYEREILINEATSLWHKLTPLSSPYLKDITLYFAKGKDLYKMGMISGVQVSSLIEMVNLDCIEAYYDKDTKLEGSLIYSLCSI